MDNIPPPPPPGEADEAPATPASKRPWTKPRIKPLRVISTHTGTIDQDPDTAADEDLANTPGDIQINYRPS